jgi:hypothetical protein
MPKNSMFQSDRNRELVSLDPDSAVKATGSGVIHGCECKGCIHFTGDGMAQSGSSGATIHQMYTPAMS